MNAGDVAGDGYMTRGRAAAYERRLAAMQAAFEERAAGLERQIAELRASQIDLPRALVAATLDVVRRQQAGVTRDERLRGLGGGGGT